MPQPGSLAGPAPRSLEILGEMHERDVFLARREVSGVQMFAQEAKPPTLLLSLAGGSQPGTVGPQETLWVMSAGRRLPASSGWSRGCC